MLITGLIEINSIFYVALVREGVRGALGRREVYIFLMKKVSLGFEPGLWCIGGGYCTSRPVGTVGCFVFPN